MWNKDVETEIADVIFDIERQECDIVLEKRITELTKESIVTIANLHG